jgi:hypothetical protein
MPVPPYDPGVGRSWQLQRNVLAFDVTTTGQTESGINITPAWDGRTTFGVGANYSHASGADRILERWYFVQVECYTDHVITALMAVEEGKGSGSTYIAVYPGDVAVLYPGPPAMPWPPLWDVTYTNYVKPPPGTTLGIRVVKIVADIWVALPVSSALEELNPESPLLNPEPILPPTEPEVPVYPQEPHTPLVIPVAHTGIQITWPRAHHHLPRSLVRLGGVAGLTWEGRNGMWVAEKTYMLDGLRLMAEALPGGGHRLGGEYRFIKLPGADDGSTGSGGQWGQALFIIDETSLDDQDFVLG